jgi:hypothetical protein
MGDTDLERWAQTWASAGSALNALRHNDLAAMTDDDVRRLIADWFDNAPTCDLPPRVTSAAGLGAGVHEFRATG